MVNVKRQSSGYFVELTYKYANKWQYAVVYSALFSEEIYTNDIYARSVGLAKKPVFIAGLNGFFFKENLKNPKVQSPTERPFR